MGCMEEGCAVALSQKIACCSSTDRSQHLLGAADVESMAAGASSDHFWAACLHRRLQAPCQVSCRTTQQKGVDLCGVMCPPPAAQSARPSMVGVLANIQRWQLTFSRGSEAAMTAASNMARPLYLEPMISTKEHARITVTCFCSVEGQPFKKKFLVSKSDYVQGTLTLCYATAAQALSSEDCLLLQARPHGSEAATSLDRSAFLDRP